MSQQIVVFKFVVWFSRLIWSGKTQSSGVHTVIFVTLKVCVSLLALLQLSEHLNKEKSVLHLTMRLSF